MKSTSSYTHVFSAGEVIFQEGEPGGNAFIIEKGKVEVSGPQAEGQPLLAEYGAGELFGETALLNDTPRTSTATAVEPTEVVAIYRPVLDMALDNVHPVVNLLMHTMLQQRCQGETAGAGKTTMPSAPAIQEAGYQGSHAEIVNLVTAENELADAIDESQFELYYQPIMALADERITGIEALVRWNHPEGGLITPAEIMPIAEKTNLIKKLGEFIMDKACQQHSRLRQELPALFESNPDFFLSINLSAKQFLYADFLEQVRHAFQSHQVNPAGIMFEITENVLMFDPQTAQSILSDFKQQGFRIAIDDFGKGYSSMSYLHSFPIDTIKIDRSFIESMHTNRTSMTVVEAIIGLAKAIGLTVIAEGVETAAQFHDVKKLGCDLSQGYYLHKPMPYAKMLALLQSTV